MFAYDSITVSSAWELISVSTCYSRVVFVPKSFRYLLSSCVCVWVSSVARSCATRDESSEDNVLYTNYISRDKSPAPI